MPHFAPPPHFIMSLPKCRRLPRPPEPPAQRMALIPPEISLQASPEGPPLFLVAGKAAGGRRIRAVQEEGFLSRNTAAAAPSAQVCSQRLGLSRGLWMRVDFSMAAQGLSQECCESQHRCIERLRSLCSMVSVCHEPISLPAWFQLNGHGCLPNRFTGELCRIASAQRCC